MKTEIPEKAILPSFPDGIGYLWEWWCGMREMNGESMDAVNIKSWFDLMSLSPQPWEVQAISGITRKLHESRS